MRQCGELAITAGVGIANGRRPGNGAFAAFRDGGRAERVTHGAIAVMADGFGGVTGGRIAAELVCRDFVDAYLSLPPMIGIPIAAERGLRSFNRWLHAMALTDPALAGVVTTFACVILRGRNAHTLHAGSDRIWLFRDGALRRLTTDHVQTREDQVPVLTRAVGRDTAVLLDHFVQPLAADDRLLITNAGVHVALSEPRLARLLEQRGDSQQDAAALVEAARAAGSEDDCAVVLMDVIALPELDDAGLAALVAHLPIRPLPEPGGVIDGFRLERRLADGRMSRLFVATELDHDGRSGPERVLKFPKPAILGDAASRDAFLRELVIGAQVTSPFLGEVLQLPPERQTRLYLVMPYYGGETLETRLERGPLPIAAGITLAAMLARGVIALHRRGVVHRDIKPANVLLCEDGGLRLLDLGAARLPLMEEPLKAEMPGTQGYIAPELYRGEEEGGELSDQFALGVTLYRMFTLRFPYSDIASFHRQEVDSAADPVALRPELPDWLATAMRRAVRVRPVDRFGDVAELLAVLEGGSPRAQLTPPRRRPLLQRNPVLFWQGVALLLGAMLVLDLLAR